MISVASLLFFCGLFKQNETSVEHNTDVTERISQHFKQFIANKVPTYSLSSARITCVIGWELYKLILSLGLDTLFQNITVSIQMSSNTK